MNEKKAAYDKEYQKKNIKQINIPFNAQNTEDVKLLSFIREHPNVTEYIKRLVFLDMKESTPDCTKVF